jgi:hypothetical protein
VVIYGWAWCPSGVDVLVAWAADDQGLASPHGHEVHPGGFGPAAGLVEVGEFADVVHLEAGPRLADLAVPGKESADQLVAPGAGHDWPLVGEDGRADSCERDPAEAGDQWLPSPIAVDGDLEDRAGPAGVSIVVLYLRAIAVTVLRRVDEKTQARGRNAAAQVFNVSCRSTGLGGRA